jgi:hypothetical protein
MYYLNYKSQLSPYASNHKLGKNKTGNLNGVIEYGLSGLK